MLCKDNGTTSRKGICECGPSWLKRQVERDFIITRWHMGPYQEYRCSFCGNTAFLDTITGSFMVEEIKRPIYDMKEQSEWYSKHCGGEGFDK